MFGPLLSFCPSLPTSWQVAWRVSLPTCHLMYRQKMARKKDSIYQTAILQPKDSQKKDCTYQPAILQPKDGQKKDCTYQPAILQPKHGQKKDCTYQPAIFWCTHWQVARTHNIQTSDLTGRWHWHWTFLSPTLKTRDQEIETITLLSWRELARTLSIPTCHLVDTW